MALIVAAFLSLGILVSPLFITAFIAAITAVAIYELLHNAAGIKSKAALIWACAYSVLNVFVIDEKAKNFGDISNLEFSTALSIIFFIFAAGITLKEHK